MNPPKWQSDGRVVQVPAGVNTEVAGSSPTRRALIFMGDGSTLVYFGTMAMQIANLQFGFGLASGVSYVIVTYEQCGSIVQQPWFGRSTAGTVNCAVIEVMET